MVYASLEANIRLDKSLQAMQKQAKGASDGYKMLLDEKDALEKQLKTLKGLSKEEDASVLDKLLAQNTSLKDAVAEHEKKLKKVQNELEVVQRQASSQSDAYMKLMDQNNALEKNLDQAKTDQAIGQNEVKDKEISRLTEENESLKEQLKDFDFMFTEKKKKDD